MMPRRRSPWSTRRIAFDTFSSIDAASLAREVMARAQRWPCAVFITEQGEARLTGDRGSFFQLNVTRHPDAFVGVYDQRANIDDIVDDLNEALPRIA
jgi:hypothetical protein